MPEITSDTPRETYTIAGESFNVPLPYAVGHALTEGEANALNQTWAENIRNNLAGKIKEAKEAGSFDAEVFQGTVDDYADGYEFGVRTGGGRTGDPVMAEALTIARDLVRKAIVKQGKYKLADVKAAQITSLAKGLIEKNPTILETAKARVEEVRAIADVELGDLSPASEGETEAEPRKARAKAAAE
jgi:hypothetical protein